MTEISDVFLTVKTFSPECIKKEKTAFFLRRRKTNMGARYILQVNMLVRQYETLIWPITESINLKNENKVSKKKNIKL